MERTDSVFGRLRMTLRTQQHPDPEQMARERAEYHARLLARAAQCDAGGTDDDVRTRMGRLGCPEVVLRALWAPVETQSTEAARKFIADRSRPFLALLGPPGVGKSVAAGLVLQAFVQRFAWNRPTGAEAPPAMFVPAADLTRTSLFGPQHSDWLRHMSGCSLLILDDVGDEATELGKATLVDVLLARERQGRRSVLTGNMRGEVIRARYSEALADRLASGAIAPNLWGGKSMRTGR